MFDIIVLGATGFTGRLITRYLYEHVDRKDGKFSFAIAGRSIAKLQDLARAIVTSPSDQLQMMIVDVTYYADVETAVKEAKVVVNAVGPFWRWGKPIVKACARNGTNYVDLAGETPYVQEIIAEFDYLACKNHAVIIPSCAFDSVPSDIAVFLSAKTLKEAAGADAAIAESHTAYKIKGGASGGTLATYIATLEEIPRKKLLAALKPFSLSPITGARPLRRKFIATIPYLHPRTLGIDSPLVPHNCSIVQRTWGLFQVRSANTGTGMVYGMDFKYQEYLQLSSRVTAFFLAVGFAFGQFALRYFPPARWLFKTLATPSGKGPSDDMLESGMVCGTNITISTPSPQTGKITVVKTVMKGKGDPAYALSAVMISEAGLSLIDKSKLPPMGQEGGVLTPMTAIGDTLIERLERSSRFEFESAILEVE